LILQKENFVLKKKVRKIVPSPKNALKNVVKMGQIQKKCAKKCGKMRKNAHFCENQKNAEKMRENAEKCGAHFPPLPAGTVLPGGGKCAPTDFKKMRKNAGKMRKNALKNAEKCAKRQEKASLSVQNCARQTMANG
jgi:hypothetical protein